jgi:hypothetical protein
MPGFLSKLMSWTTIAELCFMKDILLTLRQFSLFYQEEDSYVMDCHARISTMINSIFAMNEGKGPILKQLYDTEAEQTESGYILVLLWHDQLFYEKQLFNHKKDYFQLSWKHK